MIGKTTAQQDFFSVSGLAPSLVAADSFYGLLHHAGPLVLSDADFASMYDKKVGRPSIPPSLLATVLLLQRHDKVSDREAARRVRCDLSWKYALHLPIDHMGFAHANLCHFRARLLVHGLEGLPFDKLNQLAVDLGLLQANAPRAMDSSHIFGAAAVEDTYALLRSSMRKLLLKLVAKDALLSESLIESLDLSAYQDRDKPSIDWDDAGARSDYLQVIVRDARRLLAALKGTVLVDDEVVGAASLLSDILNQDITGGSEVSTEADLDADDPLVAIKQGVAKDRTVSTVDTEMRHGRKHSSKRFDGYKVHIGEDLATELITDLEVTAGNAHDSEPVEAMLDASAEKLGAYPSELLGDTHYGTADLRVALDKNGIDVVAKVAGGSAKDRFSKLDFVIDLERGEVTCPAGHTTSHHHQMRDDKGRKTRCYLFGAARCGACSLRQNCTSSANGRSIRLHYHEGTLAAARRYNQSEAFKTKYRRRALVERKLSELLWRHDLRHGRYMGQAKIRLQALWTAAVVNLKRLFKLLGALPYPLGTTPMPPKALLRVAT